MDGQDALMSLTDKFAIKLGIRLALAFFAFQFMASQAYSIPPGTADDVMANRPHAVGSPVWLMEKNNCWQSGNHDYPGHVIARTNAGDWKIYGQAVVDNTLAGKSSMVVYAYCN